jgi:Uma2 family endonuclease
MHWKDALPSCRLAGTLTPAPPIGVNSITALIYAVSYSAGRGWEKPKPRFGNGVPLRPWLVQTSHLAYIDLVAEDIPQRRSHMTAVISPAVPRAGSPERIDEEPLFEIIDGQRVEISPMSILASRVTSNLQVELGFYVHAKRLGEALMETLFRLPLPVDRNRRPDLAFVSAQTIAQAAPQPGSDNAWAVLPELMVEVVSPHDIAEDIIERLNEYFAAGTKLVWIVYPTPRLLYVYESPRQVRILGAADELDGGVVLPGFRIPIASLFPA